MSKYSVVSELVKIANTLDESGFIKEANTIDKLAKKIVTSSVDAATYQKDIENYRKLINDAHNATDPKIKKQFLQQATNQYNGVLNSMWSRYDPQQKQAFRAQTNRIRNEYQIGEGTDAAPGYGNGATPGWLNEEAKNLIDNRVVGLDAKIKQLFIENPDETKKANLVWNTLFEPIANELKNRELYNMYAQDYLNRTYSIMNSKHGLYHVPDKHSSEF